MRIEHTGHGCGGGCNGAVGLTEFAMLRKRKEPKTKKSVAEALLRDMRKPTSVTDPLSPSPQASPAYSQPLEAREGPPHQILPAPSTSQIGRASQQPFLAAGQRRPDLLGGERGRGRPPLSGRMSTLDEFL